MSFTNPTTSFIQEYGSTVQMMAQQTQSKLREAVRVENVAGERHYFELYGENGDMNQVTTRFEDINPTDTLFERRAVGMLDYDFSQFVDSFDKLKMLIDPTSSIVQAQAAQMNRKVDDIIIASLYADMKTGKTGSSTSSLTETVAINSWAYGTGSGNSNLTISKLIEAAGILDENDVAMEDRYIVMDPVNHSKLLATAEATSSDFITSRSLETGKVDGLVGFKFIKSTRLPTDGSGYRRCFAWHKSGMALGIAKNPTFDISQRKDKRGQPWQAYLSLSMAGTRLENDKVVEIKCLAS
mgnify:FL=1